MECHILSAIGYRSLKGMDGICSDGSFIYYERGEKARIPDQRMKTHLRADLHLFFSTKREKDVVRCRNVNINTSKS
jgi:hypothetical protein